ncbi:TetR/AcrR family transcriptional regulator [Mycobacterium sp.]|uniref:TetR/AcrR family transcriptional regulator n=1 Tax=Mycobacterium sp. TaxID=1785 RepID=UPI003D11651A
MPANDWLAERRTEVAADRILDAAEQLFTRHDPGSVGMNEIAKAAGCSRATLYRYFENREALRNAYVARETHRLSESIDVDDIKDPRERLVTGILTTLRLVRESPELSAWFATTSGPLGAELAEQSDVITGLSAAFVTSLGDDHRANVAGRGRWLVRAITSLLIFPGRDEADERAMLTEFVAPVVVPAEQVSRALG